MGQIAGLRAQQGERRFSQAVVQELEGGNGNGGLWVRPVGGATALVATLSGTVASAKQPTVVELPGNNAGGGVARFIVANGSTPTGVLFVCNEPISTPSGSTAYATAYPTLVLPLLPKESFEIPPGTFRIVLVGSADNAPYTVTYPRDAFYTKLHILAVPATDATVTFQVVHPDDGTYTLVYDGGTHSDAPATKTYYIDLTTAVTTADVANLTSDKLNSVFGTVSTLWANYVSDQVMVLSYDSRYIEGISFTQINNTYADYVGAQVNPYKSKRCVAPVMERKTTLVLSQYDNVVA